MAIIKLKINNTDLIEEVPIGILASGVSAGSSSITVESIASFAINQILMLGNVGQEKTEIVKTSASVAPSGTTVTLASTNIYAHARGDTAFIIKWDRYEISHATTSGGAKTVLTTTLGSGLVAIDPERVDTLYYDSEYSSGGYYVRKYNSITGVYSDYSDYIPYTGLASNTAGAIIKDALVSLGEKMDSDVITTEFLFSALNEGRDEMDGETLVDKWSFRNVFDYNAGPVIAGQNEISLPSNFRDPETFKNLLSVKIGQHDHEISYLDKRALDRYYQGIGKTTLNGAIVTADTSITLTDSGDFADSGSISIAGASVSDTIDIVTYTANTLSTNVISGVTGIKAAGHATGAIVWQNASFGIPDFYTVYDGKIVFNVPFSDTIAGENVYLDYYKKITEISSEGDELDEPFFKIFIPYLRYRIKLRKNPQMDVEADADYKSWVKKRDTQAAKAFTGQDLRVQIDIP